MALPAWETARLWIDYSYRGQQHSMLFRYATGTAAAAAAAVVRAALEANAAAFYIGTSFEGARVAEPTTNVSNPVPWTPLTGSQGPNGDVAYAGLFYSLAGRDNVGHKTRLFVYGAYSGVALEPDFRLQPGESSLLDSLRTDLLDVMTETDAVTIAQLPAVYHNYWNVGISAYRQRKARTTVSG